MKSHINAQKVLFLFAVLFLGLTACKKNQDVSSDIDTVVDNSFVINNNLDDLNTRMKIVHDPILFSNNLKEAGTGNCGNYTWYLVAEVDAPIFDGAPLSATDVRVVGNKAYVSYNRQGDVHAGGIEIIDISDPAYPEIKSFMEFDGVDINTLAVDETGTDAARNVYLAGSSNKKGAILRTVVANDGYFNGGVSDISLSKALRSGEISASANGIALSNDYIYVSAGNTNGGTFQLDKNSMTLVSNEEYSDAKAIALNGLNEGDYQLTLIGGDDAKLNVYHIGTDRTLVRSIPLGSIVHQNVAEPYLGKATVSIRQGEKVAFIAMNSGGMKAVNIETGALVYTSPADMLTTGNTHGLTIDDNSIYMANSDDGLYIGCIPEDGGEIVFAQHWDLDETGASANMVQTSGDWVFVAKGGGGLKILRKVRNTLFPTVDDYDENGRPNPVDGTETLCEDLIASFNLTLPEGKNAIRKHHKYFENENREVILTERADVAVSFVTEGAGFKNAFGYYTYNKNNPPQSIDDIKASMTIIFANASATGSGGTLNEGDRVDLGSFDAGTVIGYFVISDGWNGFEVTEGLNTFFTNPNLNRGGTQQSLMMYSENCGSLLTSFEDIHISRGDKDYNDLVVKTSISPMSAMSTTGVLKMTTRR